MSSIIKGLDLTEFNKMMNMGRMMDAENATRDANYNAEAWQKRALLNKQIGDKNYDIATQLEQTVADQKKEVARLREKVNAVIDTSQEYRTLALELAAQVKDLTARSAEQQDMMKFLSAHDEVLTHQSRTRSILLAGMKASLREAIKELEKSNPDSPLVNKDYRQKLFEKFVKQGEAQLAPKITKKVHAEWLEKTTRVVDKLERNVADLDSPLPMVADSNINLGADRLISPSSGATSLTIVKKPPALVKILNRSDEEAEREQGAFRLTVD